MAISPQQLTIYSYSAHRAVIFAIAHLSCLLLQLETSNLRHSYIFVGCFQKYKIGGQGTPTFWQLGVKVQTLDAYTSAPKGYPVTIFIKLLNTVWIRLPTLLHRVSEKNKQYYFCYNYVKLPPNLTIFGTKIKDGKGSKIIWGALIFHLT